MSTGIADKTLKSVIERVYMVRQGLTADHDAIGAPRLEKLIRELRSLNHGTREERQAWVRRAIVRSKATTVNEIAGDTRLPAYMVREILEELNIVLPDEENILN